MATRTFRGTIDSDWHKAGNWLEGAVPVAGDDVVFDDLSGNCHLTANAGAAGASSLRTLIMTNYTGTFTFNGYTVFVGNGYITGTIFDAGTSCTFVGPGQLQFYSTSNITSGVNVIKANNTSLQTVDFNFNANSNARVFFIDGNCYMKSLLVTSNKGIYIHGNYENMYIYGNINVTMNPTVIAYAGLAFHNTSGTVNIMNEATISVGNGVVSATSNIYIYNSLTMTSNIYLSLTKTNGELVCTGSGRIITGTNLLTLSIATASNDFFIDFNNQSIDNLYILNTTANIPIVRLRSKLMVNKLFMIYGVIHPSNRIGRIILRNQTNNVKQIVELGNECKYVIFQAQLQDLSFNKPVRSFYSQITNCDNITSGEYPEICVNVY